MYKKILLISILVFLITGCSNNPQAIKPDKIGNQHSSLDANIDRNSTISHDLKFPISDDPVYLANVQSIGFAYLGDAITSYYKVNGYHENSLETLINNGFLLLWPRNVSTGEPVSITGKQFNDPNSELFGTISYRKLNDDTVKTTRVSYRPSESGDWHFIQGVYPGIGEMEIADIAGCSANLTSIDDPETRYILAMFGQLTDFLFSGTGNFETQHHILPAAFQDLLGPEMVVIKENFQSFVDLVQQSNVVFKWGIDKEQMSNYVYLEIDGITYIKHCIDHSEGSSMSVMKTMLTCEYDMLDTSSPILTEKNLSNVEIDDEYFASKNSIAIQE
ncbi:hypothetical protein J7L05_10925 [bacterium]|nr:hypothetical protein [bacterium]